MNLNITTMYSMKMDIDFKICNRLHSTVLINDLCFWRLTSGMLYEEKKVNLNVKTGDMKMHNYIPVNQ